MVMMAAILPVAILFLGFVIDVANWFEHDRHLQTQADAAALAGAVSFLSCPNNTPIHDKVNEYSGTTWNSQVGDTQDSVHVLLNSRTYYNQPSSNDSSVVTGEPCAAKMVDVKVTETDLPWWYSIGNVDFLNAHARVEFHKVDTLAGALPLGVPDVNPTRAAVTFVDEDKAPGAVDRILGTATLTRKSYTNGMAIWDNVGAPVTVRMDRAHVGARVALGGGTSTTCGDPLVECYDLTGNNGVLFVRGWLNDTATATAPKARDVQLLNDGAGACPDKQFASVTVACNVGVQAKLDFGAGSVPTTYTVQAETPTGSQKRTMTFNSTTGLWRTGTRLGQQRPHPGGPGGRTCSDHDHLEEGREQRRLRRRPALLQRQRCERPDQARPDHGQRHRLVPGELVPALRHDLYGLQSASHRQPRSPGLLRGPVPRRHERHHAGDAPVRRRRLRQP